MKRVSNILKKAFLFQSVFFIVLLTVNLVIHYFVDKKIKALPKDIEKLPSPPHDMAYLEYCDGGISKHLISNLDNISCLAEYPGEFSQNVFLSLSLIGFVIIGVINLAMVSYKEIKKKT